MALTGRSVLLIIGGGIAAYKSLDLIRRLQEQGAEVHCILTEAATAFVTPLSVSALCGNKALTQLLSVDEEVGAGHIRLARHASLIIVAPATADLMAKMATGLAGDLATAVLLAATCPVLIAPAMNPTMWQHPATQRNFRSLKQDGILSIGPNKGAMAEKESGTGRMAEPMEIVEAAKAIFQEKTLQPLKGKKVLVTAGPTYEALDPVRFIGNRSSGKQGFAIARAARDAGADVTLVSGPVALSDPEGVQVIRIESARDMLKAVTTALPVDIAIFSAAVADWRAAQETNQKIKKTGTVPPSLNLVENPDILATIAHLKTNRPGIVVGFAAETSHVVDYARQKLQKKGCDLIIANDVSPETGIMGGDSNTVHLVSESEIVDWPAMSKDDVARKLIVYLEQLSDKIETK